MRVTFLPFFSQQRKDTGKFLLNSCGSTKMCLFMAERVAQELGDARMILPWLPDCDDNVIYPVGVEILRFPILANNLQQRLHWNPDHWDTMMKETDVLINCHELLGWPLKNLYPKAKIIQMNVVRAEEPWPWMAPLFHETWKAVDRLVCLGEPMKTYLSAWVPASKVSVWPLSYDTE